MTNTSYASTRTQGTVPTSPSQQNAGGMGGLLAMLGMGLMSMLSMPLKLIKALATGFGFLVRVAKPLFSLLGRGLATAFAFLGKKFPSIIRPLKLAYLKTYRFFQQIGRSIAKLGSGGFGKVVSKIISPVKALFTAIGTLFSKGGGGALAKLGGKIGLTAIKAVPFIGWAIGLGMAVWDFIQGFKNTKGNMVDKIFGGLFKALTLGLAPQKWIQTAVDKFKAFRAGFSDVMVKTWDWIKDATISVGVAIWDGIKWIGGALASSWTWLVDKAKWLGDKLWSGISWVGDKISEAWTWVKTKAVEMGTKIKSALGSLADKISSAFSWVYDRLTAVSSMISNKIKAIFGWLKEKGSDAMDKAKDLGKKGVGAIKNIMGIPSSPKEKTEEEKLKEKGISMMESAPEARQDRANSILKDLGKKQNVSGGEVEKMKAWFSFLQGPFADTLSYKIKQADNSTSEQINQGSTTMEINPFSARA